jgi:sulfonate transport system ATP-binding protein
MALELSDQMTPGADTASVGTDLRIEEHGDTAVAQAARRGAPVVTIRGYGRRFGDRTVLAGIDLDIHAGELVALLGKSGSGKSTLLRALYGQDPNADGTIVVPKNRAVAFQDHRLLPWKRVWRNVLIGVKGSKADALASLEEVGIRDRADAWPGTLSGGESQRVALARAFIREPKLLLLDEPFGALDALTRLRMHKLLRELCAKHNPATLLVTHDVDEAILLADRILVISDQRISLDHRIGENPSARTGPEALTLRARLLEELGVDPTIPTHPQKDNEEK